MKSSTIRRSNLSKEKIAVLEALSKFNSSNSNSINNSGVNSEPIEDGSPEVYVRQNKEKELDILWKDFKLPKGERSPIVYLGIGFISGIVATLLVTAFIGMSSGDYDATTATEANNQIEAVATVAETPAAETKQEKTETEDTAKETAKADTGKKFGLFGGNSSNKNKVEEPVAQQNKEYEVQSGDTMDKIVRTYYGTYSPEKVEAIMNANKMDNPNKLSIGQKLIIPAEGIVNAE